MSIDLSSDVESNRLESQDVAAAERLMTRYFSEEYRCLSQKRTVPAASSILSLNPFLDQKGLVRACGRVTASESLLYDERHPIILRTTVHSRLLVQFTHLITLHVSNQLVVRLTWSRYWVPRTKNLVKAVINSCKVSVIHKKEIASPDDGKFPERASVFFPSVHVHRDGLRRLL